MNISAIIAEARAMAQQFVAKGHESVRLPAFDYEDWRQIYRRPAQGSSLDEFRKQSKTSFYLMHFLREMGVEVLPVPIKASEFMPWAAKTSHDLTDGHELAHAVGEYVNDEATPVTACRHSDLMAGLLLGQGPALATVTIFGENNEQPEVMSVVIHRPDGQVLDSAQFLAADHSPQEAWDQAVTFLDRYHPGRVFQDHTVRYPNFCPDCNALLVNVASAADIEAAAKQ
ncbi:MAG: hypothetical protein V1806_04805 [Pseudomonadota bacterium]